MIKDLTYEQAMTLSRVEDKVKQHIKNNYPDKYYGRKPSNILGRFGHGLSKTSWSKLAKLSKTDEVLHEFIKEYNIELSLIMVNNNIFHYNES
jgi:hypothetical protein